MKELPWWVRGRWLVGHLVIGAAVIVMANLAAWQFDRLDERKAENREKSNLVARAPVAVGSTGELGEKQRWEKVSVDGWPLEDQRFLVRYQLLEGRTGYWLIEPVVTEDGQRVLVNLGWVPQDVGEALPRAHQRESQAAPAEAVEKPVRYEGYAIPGEACPGNPDQLSRPQSNAADPPVLTIADFACTNLRLQGTVDAENTSNTLDSQNSLDPRVSVTNRIAHADAEALQLKALPGPDLTEGPHFSYALQWIAFCVVIGLGWITLLFRVSRGRHPAVHTEPTLPR